MVHGTCWSVFALIIQGFGFSFLLFFNPNEELLGPVALKMVNMNKKKSSQPWKVLFCQILILSKSDFESVKGTVISETGLTSICRKKKTKKKHFLKNAGLTSRTLR